MTRAAWVAVHMPAAHARRWNVGYLEAYQGVSPSAQDTAYLDGWGEGAYARHRQGQN